MTAHPGAGVLFTRSGWTGGQRMGVTWGGDQLSDLLVAAGTGGGDAHRGGLGHSYWSHDVVGGYLGRRAVERALRELLLRWAAFGAPRR